MSVAQPPAFRTLLFVWNEKYAGGGFFFLFLLGPLDVFPSCRPRLSITCRFAPQWVYERRSSRWGFYLGSRFNTQQSTPKIDSTFKMPQTPVRCGFKVQNGSTTQLGWIKKKEINILSSPSLQLCPPMCFYLCSKWCLQCLVSPLREVFFSFPPFLPPCCVVTSEELPRENTLCQPAVRQAHKQDHLAIISSQAQICAAKQTFIRKNGRWGKNGTGGGRFGREGWGGDGGCWG